MNKKEILLITFIGFILTTILTWPFLFNIGSFYQIRGDYPLEGWKLWYNFFSISTGRIFNQISYYNSNQFYFYPFSFAYSDNVFVPGVIFSVIYGLSKNLILSVNSYTFLTFVLTFISSFYSLKYFVKNSHAAMVGATIFTFNPLTFAHFPGHLQLMNKFFLPPTFLFGYKFFTKAGWRDAIFFFLFFTLNSLSSIYFFVFSLILIPLMMIPIMVSKLVKREKGYWVKLFKHLPLGILFLPILIYFNFPYLEFSNKEMVTRSLSENRVFSAGLIDWITPHPENILYKSVFQYLDHTRQTMNVNYAEKVLFLNITPVILLALGLWRTFKRSKAFFALMIYLLLLTGLLTFGPFFSISNKPENLITLPYLYLYDHLTFLQGIRAPSRFQFAFYMIFALSASYGALWILNKFRKKKLVTLLSHNTEQFTARSQYSVTRTFVERYLAALLRGSSLITLFLISLICLENLNSYSGTLDRPSPAYTKFEQPATKVPFLKNKITLHLPARTLFDQNIGDETAYLVWVSQTQENMLNGYSGYFPVDWNILLVKFKDTVDIDNIKILKALGVQYLVIHKDLLNKNFRIELTARGESTVFEDQYLKIIDLDKINPAITFCNLKDLSLIQVRQKDDGNFVGLELQNKNDCYLVNKYEDRYLEFRMSIDSSEQKVQLRLPLVIGPNETVTLSQSANNLKLTR